MPGHSACRRPQSVDVVSASSVRNPYFKQRVLDTGELLYAA